MKPWHDLSVRSSSKNCHNWKDTEIDMSCTKNFKLSYYYLNRSWTGEARLSVGAKSRGQECAAQWPIQPVIVVVVLQHAVAIDAQLFEAQRAHEVVWVMVSVMRMRYWRVMMSGVEVRVLRVMRRDVPVAWSRLLVARRGRRVGAARHLLELAARLVRREFIVVITGSTGVAWNSWVDSVAARRVLVVRGWDVLGFVQSGVELGRAF